MIKGCWCAILVFLWASVSLAGPNGGGMLVVHDAGLLLSATDGSVRVCDQGVVPTGCSSVDTQLDWTRVRWDGTDDAGARLSSGIYWLRLNSGTAQEVQKMVVLQ